MAGSPIHSRQRGCRCGRLIGGLLAWSLFFLSLFPIMLVCFGMCLLAIVSVCYRRPEWCPRNVSRNSLWALEDRLLKRMKHTRREIIRLPCGVEASIVRVTPGLKRETPPYVFVHGLASDSVISFHDCMNYAEAHGVEMVCRHLM